MSRLAAVSRNTAWLFGGRVTAQLLGVAVTVLLAARLGLIGLGQYAFVSAVVFLANVATTFGTDMILIREIAARGRVERWAAAFAVQLALSALAIALIWMVAPVLPGQTAAVVVALRIFALSLVPAALFSVCTAVLRGVGMMRTYAVLGVLAAAVQLGAVAFFVRTGAGIARAMSVLLAVQVVTALVAWAACAWRVGEVRALRAPRRGDVADMARTSASVGVLGLLGVLYQRLGAIVVPLFVGPAATGWFAGASRVVDASKTGHLALFSAVYPAMAESGAESEGGKGNLPPFEPRAPVHRAEPDRPPYEDSSQGLDFGWPG